MTSSHRHGTSRLASAGDVDATLASLQEQVAVLDARVKALESSPAPRKASAKADAPVEPDQDAPG